MVALFKYTPITSVLNRIMTMSHLLKRLLMPLMTSIFFMLALVSPAQAAVLTANVDRQQITENDSFRLFLRFDEQVAFGQPDLTELKRNFSIINQQRSNQFRSMNGKTVSFTEWTLTLTPIGTGDLIIPAIEFQGAKSQPIEISVNDLPPSVKEQMAKEFFFDIEVDQQSTYVQAQILYTEKLYYSVNHDNARLSELKIDGAHLVPLGDVRNYNTSVNGQRMGVYERRYAIFPEESGELIIPGQTFTGSVLNPYDRFSRGRPVAISSDAIKVQVKPAPASYPQAAWLPSPRIAISDQLSKTYDQWQVGEPVTRTITLNAKGLSGSQLPSTTLPIVDGLKYYPDQSEHEDKIDNAGVAGTFQQSLALVPTKSGRLLLPEVRIPWWNTETNTLEYAILPAQTVNVAAANQSPLFSANTTGEGNATGSQTTATNAQQGEQIVTGSHSSYWILSTLILLVINVILAFLLWKKKSPRKAVASDPQANHSKALLKSLKAACKNNDALKIREYLKQWAQAEFETTRIELLARLLNSRELGEEIKALDQFLYRNNNTNPVFNGTQLWQSFDAALANNVAQKTSKQAKLAPLYQ